MFKKLGKALKKVVSKPLAAARGITKLAAIAPGGVAGKAVKASAIGRLLAGKAKAAQSTPAAELNAMADSPLPQAQEAAKSAVVGAQAVDVNQQALEGIASRLQRRGRPMLQKAVRRTLLG